MLRLLLVFASLLIAGCGSPADPPGKPAATPNVLRLALSADIRGFDPAQSNDIPTTKVLGAVYEALLQYDYLARPMKVIPDLAAAMPEVSADGKIYTFRLRTDAQYHPDPVFGGKPRFVRSEDFVRTFQRVADPKIASGGWWVLDGYVEGLNAWRQAGADYSKPVPGLEAPAPDVFRVRLTKAYPQFLYMMTMVFAAPMPPEAHELYASELVEKDLGTGPFRLKRYRIKSRIELEKNSDYREVLYPSEGPEEARSAGLLRDAGQRLPFLDGVIYEVLAEAQPAWLKFLSGKIDMGPIPKDSFAGAVVGGASVSPELAAKGIRLKTFDSQTLWYLGMNLRDPVFQGEKGLALRKAIACAHDARRFVDLIYAGRGKPHASILPHGLPGYDPEALEGVPSYDPAKSKGFMAAAGFPDGKGAPVLTLDLRGEDTTSRQAGEFLRAELKAIGLEVDLITNTYQRYLGRARQGQVQLYVGRWVADYPDEENWTQLLYGPNGPPGTNYSGYSDPEYDRLHEETRSAFDSKERRAKLKRMQNIFLRDVPWRVSFMEKKHVLHHHWLKNFTVTDVVYNGHKYLRLDTAARGRGR